MLKLKNNSRGDTLIEVLFASAVFSLIAVGGIAVMNQGTATIQRSLEITQVRQEIDAQASALRFLNSSYNNSTSTSNLSSGYSGPDKQWALMLDKVVPLNGAPVSAFGLAANGSCPNIPANSFIFNARKATFESAPAHNTPSTYARVNYNGANDVTSADGIWIEAIQKVVPGNNQTTADYIDFHIRACWVVPGESTPMTLGTIVRLYEQHRR